MSNSMSQIMDLKKRFLEYFNEQEAFGLRSERFYDDYYSGNGTRPEIMTEWLRAAFLEGARITARDTLITLDEYATSVAGIEGSKYTSEQAFDVARKNLTEYYHDVFNNLDPSEAKMKSECDTMLAGLLGSNSDTVRKWWSGPNRAFGDRSPADQWLDDPRSVWSYLQSQCYR